MLTLRESLTDHSLALFIGADLNKDITGIPSRRDIAKELANRHKLDETLSLAEITQRITQMGNRWEFTSFLSNIINSEGIQPKAFHEIVVGGVKLHQIETIITTAYDDLLEMAFRRSGIYINHIVNGVDISFIRVNCPTLIKLYGDIQQPDSLVVTDYDHLELLRKREKESIIEEVRRTLRHKTILFIGSNLEDADFRFLFDHVADSSFARMSYAICSGLTKIDTQMWKNRKISIINDNPINVLNDLFGNENKSGNSAKRIDNQMAIIDKKKLLNKTILFLGANPIGTSKIRIDEELRKIDDGLQASKLRENFNLISKWAVKMETITKAMLDNEPQIVHFSGHGEKKGIVIEKDDGTVHIIPIEALMKLFQLFKDKVECVLLNACYSEEQAKIISEQNIYVVGMSDTIDDKAAIDFAVGFYQSIGAGKNYEFAYQMGTTLLMSKNISQAVIPVLWKNGGKLIL